MKIPTMASLDDRKLEIQPFGGLNTSKLDTEIDDNQMSDANNVYYRNKLLSMRPGLIKQIEQTYGKIVDVYPHSIDGSSLLNKTTKNGVVIFEQYGFYIITETNIIAYSNGSFIAIPTAGIDTDGTWSYTYENYNYSNCTISNYTSESKTLTDVDNNDIYVSYGMSFLIVGAADSAGSRRIVRVGNYLYSSLVSMYGMESTYRHISPYYMSDRVVAGAGWTNPYYQPNQPYYTGRWMAHIPSIYTNMNASGSGDKLESRNYLTPYVRNEFMTDTTSTVYKLFDEVLDNSIVLIQINPGQEEDFFIFDAGVTSYTAGITITLDRDYGTITLEIPLDTINQSVPNMIVTYAKTVYKAPNPVYKCTLSSWFGGSYQGETSGDSLFVSGNPDEPNAVYWSAVKDPTYFPVSNTDYVGAPSEPITAFGKAFSKLVILKENSTYEKGFSWDSVNSTAYFPTSEIHIGIGCDMPKSVQFLNNNLVWANSKDGVHTLTTTNTSTTTNIYTERIIQPLSQNINNEILSNPLADLQNAVSIDNGYYYILFVGKNIYLWDYNTTPFINYSDTVKLQNRLAWYRWTVPHIFTTMFLKDGKVWGSALENNFFYAFDPLQSTDDGVWYEAYLYSKAFDNGVPERMKQVNKIWLSMSSNDYTTVEGLLIDEYGEQTELIDIDDSNTVMPFNLSLSSDWTQQYQVGLKRIEGDNNTFGLSKFIINVKIGRLI
jgi:hypothetical protein